MERESGMGNRESIVRKAGGRAPCLPAFTHTGEDATNDSLCSKGFSAELDRYFSQQDDFLFTDLKISPFPNDEPLSTFQTRRAADRMSVVFRFAMDGESKNPDSDSASRVLRRGRRFLLPTFLRLAPSWRSPFGPPAAFARAPARAVRQQRKVGRAPARKLLPFSKKTFETTPNHTSSRIRHRNIDR